MVSICKIIIGAVFYTQIVCFVFTLVSKHYSKIIRRTPFQAPKRGEFSMVFQMLVIGVTVMHTLTQVTRLISHVPFIGVVFHIYFVRIR